MRWAAGRVRASNRCPVRGVQHGAPCLALPFDAQIETSNGKRAFFTNLLAREDAYSMIKRCWLEARCVRREGRARVPHTLARPRAAHRQHVTHRAALTLLPNPLPAGPWTASSSTAPTAPTAQMTGAAPSLGRRARALGTLVRAHHGCLGHTARAALAASGQGRARSPPHPHRPTAARPAPRAPRCRPAAAPQAAPRPARCASSRRRSAAATRRGTRRSRAALCAASRWTRGATRPRCRAAAAPRWPPTAARAPGRCAALRARACGREGGRHRAGGTPLAGDAH